MKIVVLVKHVPAAVDEIPFAADLTVDRTAARGCLNEADGYAVEQALRIAELRMDVQVTAVTMGPAQAERALRRALVLGADEAVHVLDDALHGSDALATSRVLAAAVRRLGFDLVLCGAASADSGMSVLPAMLADRLGVPAACFADALRLDGAEVIVRRDLGHAIEELAAVLPAVVSVTDRCGEPRYPPFPSVAHARHKLIRTWSLADLRVDPALVGLRAAGTVVRGVTARPGAKAGCVVCAGEDPRAAAARLAGFLTDRHFLE